MSQIQKLISQLRGIHIICPELYTNLRHLLLEISPKKSEQLLEECDIFKLLVTHLCSFLCSKVREKFDSSPTELRTIGGIKDNGDRDIYIKSSNMEPSENMHLMDVCVKYILFILHRLSISKSINQIIISCLLNHHERHSECIDSILAFYKLFSHSTDFRQKTNNPILLRRFYNLLQIYCLKEGDSSSTQKYEMSKLLDKAKIKYNVNSNSLQVEGPCMGCGGTRQLTSSKRKQSDRPLNTDKNTSSFKLTRISTTIYIRYIYIYIYRKRRREAINNRYIGRQMGRELRYERIIPRFSSRREFKHDETELL